MRRSDERLLTTHVGSIPRPAALRDLLVRQDRGEPVDEGALARETEAAVRVMTAGSPGTIATILLNRHYDSHERYVMALAREMRKEYELIHARGLVLQLDCPDLAMERVRFFQHESLEGFQRAVALHIEAINQAIVNIPADPVRLHLCWGNYDGPHVHDVPLEAIL